MRNVRFDTLEMLDTLQDIPVLHVRRHHAQVWPEGGPVDAPKREDMRMAELSPDERLSEERLPTKRSVQKDGVSGEEHVRR